MTELNENHLRTLFHRFKAIDRSLFELECELSSTILNSVFRSRPAELTNTQRSAIRGYSENLRNRMCDYLTEKGISYQPESVRVLTAIKPYVLAIKILIEEIGPKYMRGYGELTDGARQELESIVSDLQRLESEFESKINNQQ